MVLTSIHHTYLRSSAKLPLARQVLTRKAAVELFVSIILVQGTPTADTAWILAICNASLILGLVVPRHCVAAHPPFRSLQVFPGAHTCLAKPFA